MDLEEGLKNVVQFQNKRTGSTFLQNALNTHPELVGLDEVFVNVARSDITKSGFHPYVTTTYSQPQNYIKQVLWEMYPNSHVMFKLMYNQVTYHKGLLQFIKTDKIPIIHLKRKNLLKQAVSYIKQTKMPALTPSGLFDYVVMYEEESKRWTEEFKDHDILELFYEDMIGETKEGFTFVSEYVNMLICGFFNVRNLPMFSSTKRNKTNIWDYLTDKQGTMKRFKNTKYDWMLDESKSKER